MIVLTFVPKRRHLDNRSIDASSQEPRGDEFWHTTREADRAGQIRRSDTASHSEVVILLRSGTMESNDKQSPPSGGTNLSYLEDIGG